MPHRREYKGCPLVPVLWGEEDGEYWQVFIFTALVVAQPGADTLLPGLLGTRLEKGDLPIVADRLGVHGLMMHSSSTIWEV